MFDINDHKAKTKKGTKKKEKEKYLDETLCMNRKQDNAI